MPNQSIPIGPSNIQELFSATQQDPFITPSQFGITVAIILVLVHRFRIYGTKDDTDTGRELYVILQMFQQLNYRKLCYTIVCLLVFCSIVLPVLVPLVLGCILYRLYVHRIIKEKYGRRFKGFLDGRDVVWALEDDFAKSVINVMVVMELNETVTTNNVSAEILLALRKRLSSRLLGDYKPFPKLFYTRTRERGFTFWTDNQRYSIEDYIRYVPNEKSLGQCNDSDGIRESFSQLSNVPLPFNHTASWEVLVSRQQITGIDADGESVLQVPVLFRVHHSLGDGIALLRLFLETVADKDVPKRDYWAICSRSRPSIYKLFKSDDSVIVQRSRFLHWTWRIDFMLTYVCVRDTLVGAIRMAVTMVNAPASLCNQSAFQTIDENSLHSAQLSGDKIVNWRFETEDDGNLITKIKSIKHHFVEARFSDVFIAALSISFEKYFASKGHPVPTYMTAVIPARIVAEEATFKLQNRFSVGLQTLPINTDPETVNRAARFYNKIIQVKRFSGILRNSSDYFVNYWMMSYLPMLLPASMLSNFTASLHSTLAISNLPGPHVTTTMKGFVISNLTFWLPNRGTTGIGISILSYANRLQFGIIADRAVIDSKEDAYFLLDNTIQEIRNMATTTRLYTKRNSIGELIRPVDFYTK